MSRFRNFLVIGLLTLVILVGVPSLVRAQSDTSASVSGITPRDWIGPAIQGISVLLVVLVGVHLFQKYYVQRERLSEKENLQKQVTDALDRLVATDPGVRANAALRLAEYGKIAVSVEGSREKTYPHFLIAAAQLSTALHLETNPGIRSAVRESLQILADFASAVNNESFIHTLILEAADSNRTARSAFIKALAEYSATFPPHAAEEQSVLKRLAAVVQFGDKPEATICILKSLMGLHEFERDREIYTAVRATLDPEALHRADVARLSQVEITATALRETRDALAYALRCLVPSPNTPAELAQDPQIAERKLNDGTGQAVAPRLNLSGCFLSGAQINRAFLRRIDLRDAFLQGASLIAADLQGALLMNAQLQEASLGHATLQWANLNNASLEQANLANAKLKGASLNEAHLFEADLVGVSFQETSLVSANFAGACLIGTSFEGACLFRINFQEANLIRANLRKAYLSEANLQSAYLTEAQMQEAVMVAANLTGAILTQARLEGAFLKGANLNNAQVFGAVLEGTIEGRRVGADFDKAFLNNLDFRNPLTGQLDTQIRDWLIRYFPREARCFAIGDTPAIAESEKTRELPAPQKSSEDEAIHDTLLLPPPPRKPTEKTLDVREGETVELYEPLVLPEGYLNGETVPVG